MFLRQVVVFFAGLNVQVQSFAERSLVFFFFRNNEGVAPGFHVRRLGFARTFLRCIPLGFVNSLSVPCFHAEHVSPQKNSSIATVRSWEP